jgi:hypothetical protein
MYVGCVAGALLKDEYMEIIREAGFTNVKIQKEKAINIPGDILSKYLSAAELEEYEKKGTGIFSITVYAEKSKDCCDTNCCK